MTYHDNITVPALDDRVFDTVCRRSGVVVRLVERRECNLRLRLETGREAWSSAHDCVKMYEPTNHQ